MGGPFRAIVGGAAQNMSFAPAQAIELNNYSTQYGHLRNSDIFVAPGQIGQVVLVAGITAEIFVFEGPPGASQAAPTAGQICLIKTYEEAQGPGGAPPLGPAPGLLLPMGLDSPQHFHHHTNLHLHGHSGTHAHGVGSHAHNHSATHAHGVGSHAHNHSAVHAHGHSGTHFHSLNIQVGGAIVTAVGFDAGGNFVAAAGPNPLVNTDSKSPGGTDNAAPGATDSTNLGNTDNAAPGATDSTNLGNTGSTAPGNTDNATPGDSDLENVQHTHP